LRLRCQALGESSEVTRRESGKENVRCGWVMHATQGSRCTFGRTSTVRSIFLLSPAPNASAWPPCSWWSQRIRRGCAQAPTTACTPITMPDHLEILNRVPHGPVLYTSSGLERQSAAERVRIGCRANHLRDEDATGRSSSPSWVTWQACRRRTIG